MKAGLSMARAAMLAAAGALMIAPGALAQTRPDPAYLADFAAVQRRVQELDDRSAACAATSLARSGEGRDVLLLTLAADAAKAGKNPAVLIVAGLDARHKVGVETALRVADRLLAEHADTLANVTYYIVPCANPDGFDFNRGGVNAGHVGNLRAVDNDRDGAADEDGPADINGDGAITMMRRANPPLDDWGAATHAADPAEPRLLKPADAVKGERAVYALYIEGLDSDGDGAIAEDGRGFVDLDRNFMHRWPEHEADAGMTQVSEPESVALADFVITRRNIMAAIVYGRHDNIINVPDGRAMDITGEAPRDLNAGDVEHAKALAKKYTEITGHARAAAVDTAGSFQAWLYAQRGIPTVATTVWGRPDLPEETRGDGEAGAPGESNAVTGQWSGTVTVPEMGEIAFTFTLALGPDNAVTGSVSAAGQDGTVTGTFNPVDASANLSVVYGEDEPTIVQATFKDNVMNGRHVSPDGREIMFIARRAAADSPQAGAADAPANDAAPRASPESPAQEQPQGRRGGGRRGSRGPGGPAAGGEGAGGGSGESEGRKPDDAEAAAWLKYSDSMRNGEGFIEWTPFDHPSLGPVEIGGFVPGFHMNPPPADLDDIAAKQAAFALHLATLFPRLSVQGPQATRLADGLYEVRLGIVNDGHLPTATAMARAARSIAPTIVRISTPVESIVAGDRVTRTWGIGGAGDRAAYRWIVRAEPGSNIAIDIINPHLGDRQVTIKAE